MSPDILPIESAVDRLYRSRFPAEVLARRRDVWRVLCDRWFSRYVPADSKVLEIAPGYCEFINHIQAAERVGVDLNPDTRRHAAPGVTIHQGAAETVDELLPKGHFDVAFMSNFLEHCRTREQLLAVLTAVGRVLKPGGRLMILGPNFRYCFREYYDYFDHHLPLTEQAVVEALGLAGLDTELAEPRTLPFTFRSRLPSWPWLVRLYLALPWAWSWLGQQFFIVARRPATQLQAFQPAEQTKPAESRRAA